MPQSDKIKQYTDTVCNQVRWKRSHPMIVDELKNHIEDQSEAFMTDGQDSDTATTNAITEMGDPVLVGAQFDNVHRPKPQWSMLIIIGALIITGLVVRCILDNSLSLSTSGFILKEIVPVIIGIGAMIGMYFLDFSIIAKHPKIFYSACIAIFVLLMIFSPKINGRLYYLALVCPLISPLMLLPVLYSTKGRGYWGIILCGLACILPLFINLYTPMIAGAFLLFIVALVLLTHAVLTGWFTQNKIISLAIIYLPIIVVVSIILISEPYYLRRLTWIFNPRADEDFFIIRIIRECIEGAKFFGGTVPEQLSFFEQNPQYMLVEAIVKIGWIAFFVIFALLVFFLVHGFVLCFKQKSKLGLYTSLTVMIIITFQIVNFLLSNLGIVDIFTSLSLPFISSFETPTIVNMCLIGLLLSVFRSNGSVNDSLIVSRLSTKKHKKLVIKFE